MRPIPDVTGRRAAGFGQESPGWWPFCFLDRWQQICLMLLGMVIGLSWAFTGPQPGMWGDFLGGFGLFCAGLYSMIGTNALENIENSPPGVRVVASFPILAGGFAFIAVTAFIAISIIIGLVVVVLVIGVFAEALDP